MELTNLQILSCLLLHGNFSHHRPNLINMAPKLYGVWPPLAPWPHFTATGPSFPSDHTDLLRPSCLQAFAYTSYIGEHPFLLLRPGNASASFSFCFKRHSYCSCLPEYLLSYQLSTSLYWSYLFSTCLAH